MAADGDGALGIDSLIALWLVALADPGWAMPQTLARRAVAAALRAQPRDCNAWVGMVRFSRGGTEADVEQFEVLDGTTPPDELGAFAVCVRNLLRAVHAAVGLNFNFGKWGKYVGDRENGAVLATLQRDFAKEWLQAERLRAPAVALEEELLDSVFGGGKAEAAPVADARLAALDEETRLAAFDVAVCPYTLLLAQACLSSPPRVKSKFGLPMIAKQYRKLSSEVNPRDEERSSSRASRRTAAPPAAAAPSCARAARARRRRRRAKRRSSRRRLSSSPG